MPPSRQWIVGDAHVHFHACYSWQAFLDAAFRNLEDAGRRLEIDPAGRCLVLTETPAETSFHHLWSRAESGGVIADGCDWRAESTGEATSVRVHSTSGELQVVAGAQVAASEDLEVLLIGTTRKPPDGLPIREILERTSGDGVVRVIPWGVGKWLFSRGRLVTDLVECFAGPGLFLGDEAGRPSFWSLPGHFAHAKAHGVRNLPGSDPLPFAYDEDKAGRMGFAARIPWSGERPAQSLVRGLREPEAELLTFEGLESPSRFVQSQIRMQLRKRLGATE